MGATQRIVVFSDLHLATEPGKVHPSALRVDAEARLRAGLAHAMRVVPGIDMILLCGDLTHRGDAASYAKLRAALADVPVPVVPMLGNHDDRSVFRAVFPDVQTDGAGFVQRVVRLGDWRLITLDTLIVRGEGEPFSNAGELCPERMAWLEARLAEAGDAPCIVALHHPPFDTGFASMDAIKLRDGAAFMDRVVRHRNVRHLVSGHIHRTISGSNRGIPFSIFKSPVGQMPLVWGGEDTGLECADPPAFGILTLHGRDVTVHTEDFPDLS